ncbi:MAG: F0F1 ATP synthase subunit epsilon [Oligoflexia bacterium]|nr:F0F1 ATP synthase subunit epsilon [Oligoflexia bacterium]
MLKLSLVTPSKKLLTDVEVESVFVPSYRGELDILEGHAPLMATLDTGVLKYKTSKDSQVNTVAISWGYLEVSSNHVTVLAETAEAAAEINVERAQLARERAEKMLASADVEVHSLRKHQLKLERAIIRLQVAGKSGDTNH